MKSGWAYLVAEYNPHSIYHGWHLYERDNNKGNRNNGNDWGWLRGSEVEKVREFMLANGGCDAATTYGRAGAAVPECRAVVMEFVKRFHKKCRRGTKVWVGKYGRYSIKKPERKAR